MTIRILALNFLGLMALLVLPLFSNPSQDLTYYEIVTKSFKATNGEKVALNIEGWAKISVTPLIDQELKAKLAEINQALDIPTAPLIDRYPDFIKYTQNYETDSTLIQISLQSLLHQGPEQGTYLGILITTTGDDLEKEYNYYSKVSDIFSRYPDQLDLGVTLIGAFPGNLTEKERKAIISQGFQEINAKWVEGIDTENLISYSGYTQDCPKHLEVAGNKININIALRYHSIDDKTYINIGAPLILQEY